MSSDTNFIMKALYPRPYAYSIERAEALRLNMLAEETGDDSMLISAAQMGDVDAQFNLSWRYRQRGDTREALRWLEFSSVNGNMDATCEMFHYYYASHENEDLTVKWAEKVMELPSTNSKFVNSIRNEARWFSQVHKFQGSDIQERLERCRIAAESGDALAQNTMGCIASLHGDSRNAALWYKDSAEGGLADSQNRYALLLQHCWEFPDVFKNVVMWLEKAASQGNSEAAYNLARHYETGIGVRKNAEKARAYLESAVSACNNVTALSELCRYYYEHPGCNVAQEKVESLLRIAAGFGDGRCCFCLGVRMLLDGISEKAQDKIQEAGYWLITGLKIVKVEAESDAGLIYALRMVSQMPTTFLENALVHYTSKAEELVGKFRETYESYMMNARKVVNDDQEGIVVNLHYIGPCDFKCRTCYFPRDNFMLDLEAWKTIVAKLVCRMKIKRFNLAGGEPMLASFVQKLIDFIHSLGIEVSIITNGMKLTPDFIRANRGKIQMIGISVDGVSEEMDLQIGRCTAKGDTLSKGRLIELASVIRESGIKLKIDTQVMRPNKDADFHGLIRAIKPDKWKLLQTSIRNDVNADIKAWVLNKDEFETFVKRHKDLNPLVEDESDIKNAYYMVFQYGEFVYVEGNRHVHLAPLILSERMGNVDLLPHNEEGYKKRYSSEAVSED